MPKFSVVIPTHNHAHFVKDAIDSVLMQTFQDFEIIVVDDASTDNTTEVIRRMEDTRIRYLVHPKNMGLSATKNTGIKAANGEFIAFLDADDWFHPQKLKIHLDYMNSNPRVGVTYNARFELNHSAKTIRSIWRPPEKVGLSDFVLGFPFAPSDIVIRKEWLLKAGLLDENYRFYGEDLYFNCQLAMKGCSFNRVDGVLNYRRYHSGREIKNIPDIVDVMLQVLNRVFDDPYSTPEVKTLKDAAYAHYFLWYGIFALGQGETHLGQSYLIDAIRLRPALITGEHCELLENFIQYSIADESQEHHFFLKKIFDQLPIEISNLSTYYESGVARGYLLKGIRAVFWGRLEDGGDYFDQAYTLGIKIDKLALLTISSQLLDYEVEFGQKAAYEIIRNFSLIFKKINGNGIKRKLKGNYWASRATTNYFLLNYSDVPFDILRAFYYNLTYLTNRGIVKILLYSIFHIIKQTVLSQQDDPLVSIKPRSQ